MFFKSQNSFTKHKWRQFLFEKKKIEGDKGLLEVKARNTSSTRRRLPLRWYPFQPPHNPSPEQQDLHEPIKWSQWTIGLKKILTNRKRCTYLSKFAFFHALADVPVNKSALGIHQIKFVIQTGPSLGDSSRIRQHTHSPRYFGQITSRDDGWGLVINSNLHVHL